MLYKRPVIIQFLLKSIFFIILYAVSPVMAQEPDSSSALFRLREAERDFDDVEVSWLWSSQFGRSRVYIRNY